MVSNIVGFSLCVKFFYLCAIKLIKLLCRMDRVRNEEVRWRAGIGSWRVERIREYEDGLGTWRQWTSTV